MKEHRSQLDLLNVYKNYDHRRNALCSAVDETYLGRSMWSIAANNRKFAIDLTKGVKLKPIKDETHQFLENVYKDVLENAIEVSNKINLRMSKNEFTEGYQAKAWNSNAKYPTIFDVLTEAIERWHNYYIGVGLIFDKDEWIRVTGDKLKWPKRRFGTLTQQPFERSYYIRKHTPFDNSPADKNFFEDAGMLSMFDKEIPDHVKAMSG